MILFSFINNRIILNIILLVLTISCTNQKDNVENISTENLSNEVILDIPIDLSIKNILIYPNQFDKNSIYIDAEISSHEGGEGEVQIALINDGKLVASNPINIKPNKGIYSQSFLISGDINYDKIFEISISALKGEVDISNNRYSFNSSLKIEKPKIAILSGQLNFNSPFIVNNLNADYNHFFPYPLNGDLDITDFWFNKYDIIVLDNFPIKPVSDKWLNLFLKKLYSEQSSLIMVSRLDQDFNEIKNFFPIFGLKIDNDNDFRGLNNFSRYSKESFKSSFVLTNEFFNYSKNSLNQFNDTIEWILFDNEIEYSFFVANREQKIHESIFIYGYSNLVDSDIKNLNGEVLKNGKIIDTVKFLYNPISGYYFTQYESNEEGEYIFNIIDNNKLIDTININLYD